MSYSSAATCAQCAQQSGITQCGGCRRTFCHRCSNEHREELIQQLDALVNHRNELNESINMRLANGSQVCPSLNEIDRWRMEMHATIDRVAAAARENVQELLSQASKHIRVEFDQISRDLQQRQQSGGFVEGDLSRCKQQLEQLSDAVQKFGERIQVDTSISKTIAWDSMLFVISNEENHVKASAPVAAALPSPNLYNVSRRRSEQICYDRSSMPYQSYGSNTSSPAQRIHVPLTRQPDRRSASLSIHSNTSRPQSYQCIGCKTTNYYNEYGPNNCSVCRFPAPM